MSTSGRITKRLLVGRAMRSDRLGETLLPKRIALPVFASDALSSVAYAPDEIFLTLAVAGGAFATTHSWQIGLVVVFVMLVVVASYRQNVHAYPSGGGDYEVTTVNLGPRAGLTVASALLVDYVLTVAVSISSGVQNAAAALPVLRGHVGVFVSFTLSQTGMVRHWNRHLLTERDPGARQRMMRSRIINGIGAFMSGLVLIVVLATEFLKGAGFAIAAMVVLFVIMGGISKHYSRVRTYARATRPSVLEAITVNVEPEETKALQDEWDRRDIPVPLKALDSPFREITGPVVEYVKSVRRGSPRDVVMVYIPEYVVGRWYEQILHNQSALRLKGRLFFTPGVMVASVPWHLRSSEGVEERFEGPTAGAVRRGE